MCSVSLRQKLWIPKDINMLINMINGYTEHAEAQGELDKFLRHHDYIMYIVFENFIVLFRFGNNRYYVTSIVKMNNNTCILKK